VIVGDIAPVSPFRLSILLLPWLLLASPASRAGEAPLEPVAWVDLARYMGTWHEIARYPNRFEDKCVADVTASYTLRADGGVRVVNRCRLADGSFDEAKGEARRAGSGNDPRLEVRFAPEWMSFLPFVWGDYWIVDLDEDYTLAAVGDPSRTYLWILSRSPIVPPGRLQSLMSRLKNKGFDSTKLVPSSK